MIDVILFSFFIGVTYGAFRLGAKFQTVKAAAAGFADWVKSL